MRDDLHNPDAVRGEEYNTPRHTASDDELRRLATGQDLPETLEENVLTALCWHDELAPIIATRLDHQVFSNRQYRRIAERALGHLHKYGRPPGAHLPDLLERDAHSDTGTLLRLTMTRMQKLAPNLQPEFVVERLDHFIASRRLSIAIEDAAEKLHADDLEGAHDTLAHAVAAMPEPDYQLGDPWAKPEPPDFPVHVLPTVLRDFVEDRAEVDGLDSNGLAWTAIGACAAALDSRVTLLPRGRDDLSYAVYPILRVLLIGESGAGKSGIIDKKCLKPLWDLQTDEARKWEIEHEAWEAADTKTRGPQPTRMRYVTNDPTIEALQDTLHTQPRGLTLYCDEFKQLIGVIEKYTGSRGAAGAHRGWLNQSHDGGRYDVMRLSKGRSYMILRNALGILSGVQPAVLLELERRYDLTSDGFLQRFCPVMIRRLREGSDSGSYKWVAYYEDRIRKMVRKPSGEHIVELSPEARRIYRHIIKWRQRFIADHVVETLHPFAGKLDNLFLRLCLVLSLVTDAAPEYVSGDIAADAAELVKHLMLCHALPLYEYLSVGDDSNATKAIAEYIMTHPEKSRIVPSDLRSDVRACKRTPPLMPRELEQVVMPLVNMHWLKPVFAAYGEARAWVVDQRVHKQFAARAARTKAEKAAHYAEIKEYTQRYQRSDERSSATDPDKPDCARRRRRAGAGG